MNIHEYDKFRAGKKEGIAEGIRQGTLAGAQQKAVEDAERLLKMNLGTVEQIAEAVDLTVEQVLEIKEKIAVKA